ncbi:MAG: hypothetical protein ACR2HX_06365 [Pyrinomonadaceae bacterium]
MNKVSIVHTKRELNVFVRNEHGIALAQTVLRPSYIGEAKNRLGDY